jgi:hypothetical protein
MPPHWDITCDAVLKIDYICLSIYGSTALVDLGRSFQFLNLYTIGRTPWTGDQSVARPLPTHITPQTQNKLTQIFMSGVGFEPTIPVFERVPVNTRDFFRLKDFWVSLCMRNIFFLLSHHTFLFEWLYSPYGALPLFRSPDLFTIGRSPWANDQLVARPLPETQDNTNTE